jgi:hypothetical protein
MVTMSDAERLIFPFLKIYILLEMALSEMQTVGLGSSAESMM